MIDVSNEKLGGRIKAARIKANMTQRDLSLRSDITVAQISSYENGNKGIGLAVLARLAKALGVTMDELYYGEFSERPVNTASDAGELIVNCFLALYRADVLRFMPDLGQTSPWSVGEIQRHISFAAYADILDDLIIKLNDFDQQKDNYPDPDLFLKQLLAAAAKRINDRQIL